MASEARRLEQTVIIFNETILNNGNLYFSVQWQGGNEQEHRLSAVRAVNAALSGVDPAETASALALPALALGQIHPEAAELYHSELRYVRDGSGAGGGKNYLVVFLSLLSFFNLES